MCTVPNIEVPRFQGRLATKVRVSLNQWKETICCQKQYRQLKPKPRSSGISSKRMSYCDCGPRRSMQQDLNDTGQEAFTDPRPYKKLLLFINLSRIRSRDDCVGTAHVSSVNKGIIDFLVSQLPSARSLHLPCKAHHRDTFPR